MKIFLLSWAFVVLQGCAGRSQQSQPNTDIREDTLRNLLAIANEFWSAAARQDSVTMDDLTIGTKSIAWASAKQEAFPGFFQATDGQLRLLHGYFVTARADTAIIEIRVPWQTCRPPVHSGSDDHYFIMFTPRATDWQIADVWSDPC